MPLSENNSKYRMRNEENDLKTKIRLANMSIINDLKLLSCEDV